MNWFETTSILERLREIIGSFDQISRTTIWKQQRAESMERTNILKFAEILAEL